MRNICRNHSYAVPVLALGLILATAGLFTGKAQSAPALHIDPPSCGLFDGNGFVYYTTDTHITITKSGPGNVIFTCNAQNVPNNSHTEKWYDAQNNPYYFGVPVPVSDAAGDQTCDWHEVVSASGEAIWNVHFHESSNC